MSKITRKSSRVVIDEFCDFLNSDWGGYYMDDTDESFYDAHIKYVKDQAQPVIPGETVRLSDLDGSIDWQGAGDMPADAPATVVEFYRRWQEQQTTEVLTFRVPKKLVDHVRGAVSKIIGV